MNQLVRTAPAAVLLLIATAAGADPRGLAMGGTDMAIARGADAVRWNPALLGIPDAPAFSIRLVQAGGEAGNNSFNLDQYRRLNGAVWGDAEKSEILGSVPWPDFASIQMPRVDRAWPPVTSDFTPTASPRAS